MFSDDSAWGDDDAEVGADPPEGPTPADAPDGVEFASSREGAGAGAKLLPDWLALPGSVPADGGGDETLSGGWAAIEGADSAGETGAGTRVC
ncbi:hypothetical protein [Verrucomicrobium spinosum]|uniref:hypothetical protein n=1 Tax=Verrucomicrobium spinosum TaxID=2736 RepID=UPI0012E14850|nr:hypothetical protein [Verrucomicrobium spinosum]